MSDDISMHRLRSPLSESLEEVGRWLGTSLGPSLTTLGIHRNRRFLVEGLCVLTD